MPIASISRVSFVMVVNLAVPAREIPEFIAYAKANPHKITRLTPTRSNGICRYRDHHARFASIWSPQKNCFIRKLVGLNFFSLDGPPRRAPVLREGRKSMNIHQFRIHLG